MFLFRTVGLLDGLLRESLSRVPCLLCLYPGIIRVSVPHGSRGWSELLTPVYEWECLVRAVGITEHLPSRLVVQDPAEEVAMDRQRAVTLVIDKAEVPELIHEMTHPRPGGADHLG